MGQCLKKAEVQVANQSKSSLRRNSTELTSLGAIIEEHEAKNKKYLRPSQVNAKIRKEFLYGKA